MAEIEHYSAQTVAAALPQSRGLVTYAAQMLGCSHMTVRRSMARHASVRGQRDGTGRTGTPPPPVTPSGQRMSAARQRYLLSLSGLGPAK